MGSGNSQLQPDTRGRPTTHCIVAFPASMTRDEMVLMYAVRELKDVFENAVRRSWSKGIQSTKQSQEDIMLLKMKGKPFYTGAFGSLRDSTELSRLMCALLEDSMRHGWSMRAMVNLDRESKTESLLLAHSPPEGIRPEIAAVALCSSDMISLVKFPRHLHDTLVHLTKKHWPSGISKMKHYNHEEDFGLQTKRYPFRSSDIGDNLKNSRMLLLGLIRAIYKAGYEFYGSGHPERAVEAVGTLYFAQSETPELATEMFLLAPHDGDSIITVDAPGYCVEVVRQCILQNWPKQIQREKAHEQLQSFKMNGYPFWTSGKEAVAATLTLLRIFEELRRQGWRLGGTFDAMANLDDTSTFLMMRDTQKNISMFAIRLSGHRYLTLVNAPAEIENVVRDELHSAMKAGISEKGVDAAVKFTLDRNVWNAQPVICLVVARIEACGWRLVSSADLSTKHVRTKDSQFPTDLDTLFFEQL